MSQLTQLIRARAHARPESSEGVDESIRRIAALADLLDSKFEIPGLGVRFGLDSLIGLIPVVGDTATTIVGAWIVTEGVRLGARKRVLAQMGWNLLVDWLVGLVPVLDLVLDVAFKANNRNARLLIREHEAGRLHPQPRRP